MAEYSGKCIFIFWYTPEVLESKMLYKPYQEVSVYRIDMKGEKIIPIINWLHVAGNCEPPILIFEINLVDEV